MANELNDTNCCNERYDSNDKITNLVFHDTEIKQVPLHLRFPSAVTHVITVS